jgi:hypothetical protein
LIRVGCESVEAVSTQELALVEEAVKTKLILDSVDAWLPLIQGGPPPLSKDLNSTALSRVAPKGGFGKNVHGTQENRNVRDNVFGTR